MIRSLWRSRAQKTAGGAPTEPAAREPQNTNALQPPRGQDDLRERLRTRLQPLANAAPERRCEAFVETVLLFELRESAGHDPRFTDLVGKIVRELTVDPRVSARLDQLLTELQALPTR
jgi:hypothetical protein